VLLHLVDAGCEHAGESYKTVRRELEAYDGGLAEKIEIVALSKIDTVDAETLKTQAARLKRAAKKTPLRVSAATHQNIDEVLRTLRAAIDMQEPQETPVAEALAWHP
jgi:GTP-binding protein